MLLYADRINFVFPSLSILLCPHLAPCCHRQAYSVEEAQWVTAFPSARLLCDLLPTLVSFSWWLPPLLCVCLPLPTFAITLQNLIFKRGNTTSTFSKLSGKVWSCSFTGVNAALPSNCGSFGLHWPVLCCTLYQYIHILSSVTLSSFPPSSTIHPSIHQ